MEARDVEGADRRRVRSQIWRAIPLDSSSGCLLERAFFSPETPAWFSSSVGFFSPVPEADPVVAEA